jgi:hypothetical protein
MDFSGAVTPFQCEMKYSMSRFGMARSVAGKPREEQARQILSASGEAAWGNKIPTGRQITNFPQKNEVDIEAKETNSGLTK